MRGARFWRRTAIGAALAIMTTVLTPTAAQAAVATQFTVYGPFDQSANGWSTGDISWSNRTAYVSGDVYDSEFGLNIAVFFEAFTNDTRVGATEHRTATEAIRHFGFTIGDPDKPGGINNIRISVCSVEADGTNFCGTRRTFRKP